MEPVNKTRGSQSSTAPAEAPPDKKAEGQKGEFDQVIEQKAAGQHTTRAQSESTVLRGRENVHGEKLETARGTEHGVKLLQEYKDGSSQQEGDSGDQGSRDDSSSQRRAMPGDVVVPFMLSQQPIEFRPLVHVQTMHATHQSIHAIADRIVDAVQIRMQPGGATDVHLELNMANLGNMTVELHRTSDGQIKIDFQAVTAAAQDLLKSHVSELADRLNARGVVLKEISVQTLDHSAFKFEPQPVPTTEPTRSGPSEPLVRSHASSENEWKQNQGSEQQQQDERRRQRESIEREDE